jgi:hypothetical protein
VDPHDDEVGTTVRGHFQDLFPGARAAHRQRLRRAVLVPSRTHCVFQPEPRLLLPSLEEFRDRQAGVVSPILDGKIELLGRHMQNRQAGVGFARH